MAVSLGIMPMPKQAAVAIHDMLEHCARLQPDQNVLILAANDGPYGGVNLVDETTISWIQSAAQQSGANVTVMWMDLPDRPHGWRVPPIAKAAIADADLLISHCFDLPFEELLELRQTLAKRGVPMVRNMATTAKLLMTPWAQAPYEWVSEIRYQTGKAIQEGKRWRLTHPNGTDVSGTIGPPLHPFKSYAERRTEGLYRPFPEGVLTPIQVKDTEGVVVFDRTIPWWTRYIGISPRFREPVRVVIEKNRIVRFTGGPEAEALQQFFHSMYERIGEAAYDIPGIHGGVHPFAKVSPEQCPQSFYREFIEHHHAGSVHLHLGADPHNPQYPYMLHVTTELRDATWQIDDTLIYDKGRICGLDHASVREIAERYPGRAGSVIAGNFV